MPCRFVAAPVQQLRVGRAVTATSLSTWRAQHPQLTFGTKLTAFQGKKARASARFRQQLESSNTTTGCSQIGLRTNAGVGENRTHCQHPLPTDLSPHCSQTPPRDSHTEAGEALGDSWSFSFPGTHLPLSSCAPLSPSAGIAPGGTGARTPLWGHREHRVTQTPNLSLIIFTHSVILLPGAGRGHLGCRPWVFLINSPISPTDWEVWYSGLALKPRL